MVINAMEKRKQANTKRNAGQQAKCYFHRGSLKAYLSVLFGQKPESGKELSYLLTRGKKIPESIPAKGKSPEAKACLSRASKEASVAGAV